MLGIAIIAAFIAQIVIVIGYWRGNRTNNSLGLSGGEYARKLLDQNGMPDVQVKKCGIIRTILFGNHYSITKRTVYLRMRTINNPGLTAVYSESVKAGQRERAAEHV
ncbi:MAG TPA: zinc metallopeptidase [Candidatus Ornithoclostridium faecigallinarum]|nr:zinc metallopeptidase [Candidatus Ornithoclostridium faecigallinarum]